MLGINTKIISIILTSFLITKCEGFLGLPPLVPVKTQERGNPFLSKYAKAQDGIILNLLLDIPETINDWRSSRLIVDGLKFELNTQSVVPAPSGEIPTNISLETVASSGGVPVVESNPNPNPTSSGALGMEVLSNGRFVSLKGQQTVEFTKACWEMTWEEDNLSGELVCGLSLQQSARRNDAVLPAGHVYLTFPIANKQSLTVFQDQRDEYNNALNQYYRTQSEELEKMKKTKNPFTKLVYFAKSIGNYDIIMKMKSEFHKNISTMEASGCSTLLEIGEELLLSTKGKVWTKSSGTDKEFTLVGEASLKY